MVSNQIPLNEFVTLQRGFDLPKGDRIEGSIPVVASTGVGGYHNEAKVTAPGVVIGRSGSIGGGQYIQDDFWPLNTTLWVKDFKGHHPRFVYYLFKSIDFSIFNVGSGVPTLNRNHLSSLMVKNIGVDNEKEIAKFLGDLDDKIDLNKQTNHTLEQMAQALFKSWFVDFDPVFDNLLASADFKLENLETSLPDELKQKAQRRLAALNSLENAAQCKASLIALAHELQAQLPTKETTQAAEQISEKAAETPVKANFSANPNILAQHANAHAHFPNEFEHNEQLGWIPKGWEVKPLDEIAKYQNGLALQKFRPELGEESLPVLKIAQLRAGFTDGKELAKASIKQSCIVDDGDVVFSWSGSLLVDTWCGGKAALNQHLFKVTSEEFPKWFYYQYTLFHLKQFQKIAADKAVTMGHIKREHLSQAMCVIPKDESMMLGGKITSLIDQSIRVRIQNKTLTKLRDTLLPKLISGELQIPDVATDEKIVD
ncbi:restriction endonuclease subunit S [Pseudoalteromonas nigrifaciens]|uniref:restriction endonuclease subunit S n=1 Tax=Pseudoalteromonas nigrifaciens TaxID=28109 RepID=UPI003FB691A1